MYLLAGHSQGENKVENYARTLKIYLQRHLPSPLDCNVNYVYRYSLQHNITMEKLKLISIADAGDLS